MSLVNPATLEAIKILRKNSQGVSYELGYSRATVGLDMAISLLEQLDHSTQNMNFNVILEQENKN